MPEKYRDPTKFSIVNVSDDERYKRNIGQTFTVFSMENEGILPRLCKLLTELRAEYK
jgi:hypothetical protein